jgi:hypothetical protein
MIIDKIRERLTGLSCPVGGVSWNPPELEKTKASRIIRYLEDRRVLYNPLELECPDHCFRSICDIRKFLTDEMQRMNEDSVLYSYISAMRIACRKFMDRFPNGICHFREYGCESWTFNSALGELRGTFGIMLVQIAVAFKIDIEDDLASILPEKENDE